MIDLRNNSDGLFDAEIDVCDQLFDCDELIAYMHLRANGLREKYRPDGKYPMHNYPVALLANDSTASVTEVLTGVREARVLQ